MVNVNNPESITADNFTAIRAAHAARVDSFARRYSRRFADDIAATAWMRVWENRSGFRAGAEFRPWVCTLAANAARDMLRSAKRRDGVSMSSVTETGDALGSLIADSSAVSPDASASVRDIRAAIASLPAAQGEILRLAMAGRDYAAIAGILGIPVGTVKSRLNAARAALAARLAE